MQLLQAQEPGYEVLEQAAEWFAILRASTVDDEEKRRWRAWLEADIRHREAWARVEAISQSLAIAADTPAASHAALQAAGELRQRRRWIKSLTIAALASGLGWQVARRDDVQLVLAGLGTSHRTGVGEQRKAVLDDGSHIWLNTDTALDTRYDDSMRLLVLQRGEILVTTHPDTRPAPRPLAVRSAHGSMRALGTRFQVRTFDGHTRLGVSHGRVEVTPAESTQPPSIVETGQEITFSRHAVVGTDALAPARAAWTHGMLIVDDLRLDAFLEELSRHRRGHIGCDPAVAGLRVLGGFPLGDTDRALAMLEAALPVRVRRVLPWWVTVAARR